MKLMIMIQIVFALSNAFWGSCNALGLTKESFSTNPATRARAALEEEKKNFKTASDFLKSIDEFYSGKTLTAKSSSILSNSSKGYQGVIKNMENFRKNYIEKEYTVFENKGKSDPLKQKPLYPAASFTSYGSSLSPFNNTTHPGAAGTTQARNTVANGLQFDGNEQGKENKFFTLSIDQVKVNMSKITALHDLINTELDAVAGTRGKVKVGALVGFLNGMKAKKTSGITIGRMGSTQTKIKDYSVGVVQSLIDLISITDQAKDVLFAALQQYAMVMDQIVAKDVEAAAAQGEAAKRRSETVKTGLDDQARVANERRTAELEARKEMAKAEASEAAAIKSAEAADRRAQTNASKQDEIARREAAIEQQEKSAELEKEEITQQLEQRKELAQKQKESIESAIKTKKEAQAAESQMNVEEARLKREQQQLDLQASVAGVGLNSSYESDSYQPSSYSTDPFSTNNFETDQYRTSTTGSYEAPF